MEIQVESNNGYRGQERPLRMVIGQRQVEVVEIIDRWLAPNYRYFKLRGDDGDLYIIRYDVQEDCWELILINVRTPSAE
jgi:hypothetical protein